MSAVVHYIKHWDNDTKGYIEIDSVDLVSAVAKINEQLVAEALAEGASANAYPWELVTITKAELAEGSNYVGHRSSL